MERRTTTTTRDVTTSVGELELRHDGGRVEPVTGTRAADLDLRRVLLWWRGFEDQVSSRAGELQDVGAELRAGVAAVDEVVRTDPPRLPGEVFEAVAAGFGATGGLPALLAPWFAELARSCGRDVGTHELADAAWAGLFAVQRAGGPEPGSGSLVDALAPAAEALAGADIADVPAVAALHAAYRASARGTRQTVVDGLVDPGALAVTWFFERGTVA